MYLAIAWADAFMLLEGLLLECFRSWEVGLWVISRNQCTAYHDQPNTKNWRKYIRANIFMLKRMEVNIHENWHVKIGASHENTFTKDELQLIGNNNYMKCTANDDNGS